MTNPLSPDQVIQYHRDGFLFPIDVLTQAQAGQIRQDLESAEHRVDQNARPKRFGNHVQFVLPFIHSLTRHPAITTPVASLLGDDLLVWGCSFFTKEPHTQDYVSWHQDLHYWDLDDDAQVTAWLALSPANTHSGCMRFLPGSHQQVVAHTDTFAEHDMLSRGQEIAVTVDEDKTINVELAPGQMSLHHGRTFHASHPNGSDDRRIGLAIRYITPKMRQKSGIKPVVTLACGQDDHGNFQIFDGPSGLLSLADIDAQNHANELSLQITMSDTDQAG